MMSPRKDHSTGEWALLLLVLLLVIAYALFVGAQW